MEWFRFYTKTLESAKVQELPDRLFKVWVNFMCIARIFGGILPNHREIAFRIRCSPEQALKYTHQLKEAKLIDEVAGRFVMHDWDEHQFKSDDAAGRKREWRTGQHPKSARDMHGTSPGLEQNRAETEQKQNRTDKPVLVSWPPGWDFEVWFASRIERHPIPGKPQLAKEYALDKVWVAFKPDEFAVAHEAWCEYWSDKTSGIPSLATFIFEDWWKRAPPKVKRKQSMEDLLEEMKAEDEARANT